MSPCEIIQDAVFTNTHAWALQHVLQMTLTTKQNMATLIFSFCI